MEEIYSINYAEDEKDMDIFSLCWRDNNSGEVFIKCNKCKNIKMIRKSWDDPSIQKIKHNCPSSVKYFIKIKRIRGYQLFISTKSF